MLTNADASSPIHFLLHRFRLPFSQRGAELFVLILLIISSGFLSILSFLPI